MVDTTDLDTIYEINAIAAWIFSLLSITMAFILCLRKVEDYYLNKSKWIF